MKASKIILAAALAGIAGTSFAQSSGFEGPFARIGGGYATVNLNGNASAVLTQPNPFGNLVTSQSFSNINTVFGDLSAGYNFRVNSNFLVGVGASYLPTSSSTANYSLTATVPGYGASTTTGNSSLKNAWSIYVSPGYEFTGQKEMVYAKVGMAGVTGVTSDATFGLNSTTYTGWLLGAGFNSKFTDKLYGFAEIDYTSFSSQTSTISNIGGGLPPGALTATVSSQPVSTVVLFGLGYRF
jgi:hypothetical protein